MKYIMGSANFAKEVEWLHYEAAVEKNNEADIDFFVAEDGNDKIGTLIQNKKIISDSDFYNLLKTDSNPIVYIAIGSGAIRKKIYNKIVATNANTLFPNLIHPSVNYDKRLGGLMLGIGNFICAGVTSTTNIIINNFTHVNINSTIGHDCILSSFVTISPLCSISGNVKISENTYLGTSAVILEGVVICENVIIGANAFLNKNIDSPGTYVGIPAKKLEKK